MKQKTDELILAVQDNPILWDIRRSDYKTKSLTNLIWVKISKEIGLDAAECKRRWRNIKDHYRAIKRSKNRASSGSAVSVTAKPPTKLQRMLEFLDVVFEPKPYFLPFFSTVTSLQQCSEALPDAQDLSETIRVELGDTKANTVSQHGGGECGSVGCDEVEPHAEQKPPPSSRETHKTAKKRKSDDDIYAVLETTSGDENDGDRCFLLSLLPDFKRLTLERRASLKIKMLMLVNETIYGKTNDIK